METANIWRCFDIQEWHLIIFWKDTQLLSSVVFLEVEYIFFKVLY